MSRKRNRKKNRNPLLQKKYDEGYQEGLDQGVKRSVSFFLERLEKLPNTPGIGPKTMEKIKEALGKEYFK